MRTYVATFKSYPSFIRYYEALNLECGIVPDLPGASYEIFFNGQLLTNSKFYRIEKVTTNNFGIYTCNVVGREPITGAEVRMSSKFTITQEYEPNSNKIGRHKSN